MSRKANELKNRIEIFELFIIPFTFFLSILLTEGIIYSFSFDLSKFLSLMLIIYFIWFMFIREGEKD